MQFSTLTLLSTLAAAATVLANGNYSTTAVPTAVPTNGTVTWVTDVVTSFVTFCPMATTITYKDVTYTATEGETITITNCPCTISKPVYTTSSVACNSCTSIPTSSPSGSPSGFPSASPSASYGNSTVPAPTIPAAATSKHSGSTSPSASTTPPLQVANNGNRAVALSGAGLAGLMAVAAWVL